MDQSRQQRRRHDRQRKRLHRKLYQEGLYPSAGEAPQSVVVLVHHLIEILKRRTDSRRASRAAAAVHKVFDASLEHHRSLPPLDCKLGCAHCCSLFVSAAIPEVLLLAGTIRRGAEDEAERLKAQIILSRRAADQLTIGDTVRKPVPCGLLRDNLCTQYAVRPLGCRGHVSQSVDACLANAGDPSVMIPGSKPHGEAARDSKLALFAALKAMGLPHRSYELNAALERALESDDAERRWLEGEDLFQGLPVDPTRTPAVEDILDQLILDAAT
ncbi:MAG: hypothetical protein R3229_09145 [Alphaproteobacteria bacterium]|nr:hypothetical protein [Alphaproteobacteria bacterium]